MGVAGKDSGSLDAGAAAPVSVATQSTCSSRLADVSGDVVVATRCWPLSRINFRCGGRFSFGFNVAGATRVVNFKWRSLWVRSAKKNVTKKNAKKTEKERENKPKRKCQRKVNELPNKRDIIIIINNIKKNPDSCCCAHNLAASCRGKDIAPGYAKDRNTAP